MRCPECYCEDPRITPLRGVEDCLKNHKQYICSTCGRHVCIDLKGKRRARCFMPFSSLEDAILYLKCAEIIAEKSCNIYEIIDKNSDRKSYKIYETIEELKNYLSKNNKKICKTMEPVFTSNGYHPTNEEQLKYLTENDVKRYIKDRKKII